MPPRRAHLVISCVLISSFIIEIYRLSPAERLHTLERHGNRRNNMNHLLATRLRPVGNNLVKARLLGSHIAHRDVQSVIVSGYAMMCGMQC